MRDESCHFVVSPFVRTMETLQAVAEAWGGHKNVTFTEDPRIREQGSLIANNKRFMRSPVMFFCIFKYNYFDVYQISGIFKIRSL